MSVTPDTTRRRWLPRCRYPAACVAGLLAVLPGAWAVWTYGAAGLALSHYDAKGHLVVARRVFDSITPGWQQIGAVWLPLPHLINLVPVQVDALYRSGASAIAVSMLAYALAVFAATRIVIQVTASRAAALSGATVFALNPNVLYLQATPMTEPLLLGLTLLAVSLLINWVGQPTPRLTCATGLALAAAWLTRYEAWPIVGSALALAAIARLRRRDAVPAVLGDVFRLAVYPLVALAAFLVHSRLTVGEWFVTGGFYQPDNLIDTGRPLRSLVSVWWGTHVVSSYPLLIVATAGAAVIAVTSVVRRHHAPALVTLALFGSAALPWYAFYSGHPFRIRYMVPLIAAIAVSAGIAVGRLPRRARVVGAAILVALVIFGTRPIDPDTPMVLEAQLDRTNQQERRSVTRELVREYRGETIMASMGSLAHYMQELSGDGFALRDFLHEGNGDIWLDALESPWPHAGWLLIEERAEGGDMLAARARSRPTFLTGYRRVCEGGGVALYRRVGFPPPETSRRGSSSDPQS